jgi:predicted lipase
MKNKVIDTSKTIEDEDIKITSILSRLVYENPQNFLKQLRQHKITNNFRQVTYIHTRQDTQIYILEGKEKNIIGFRGTCGFRNLYNNLKMWQTPISECGKITIHTGFWLYYKYLQEPLFELFNNLQKKKTIFTGHSLGGALACIAALELAKSFTNHKEDMKIISYGAPRIGNLEFSKNFKKMFSDKQLSRITNKNDIITKLPPTLLNYSHIGENIATTPTPPGIISHFKYLNIDYLELLWNFLKINKQINSANIKEEKLIFQIKS